MPTRHLLLLKSVRVRLVRLVALKAEGEIVTPRAVKSEHQLGDWFHAAIAAVPQVVPIVYELLLRRSLGFLGD